MHISTLQCQQDVKSRMAVWDGMASECMYGAGGTYRQTQLLLISCW